ncbi:B12-binding domain-containing radical SAM protein [Desulfuromonas versatilis]|uniref:B12-binding domain-containing radical SAM protein n=1 Tax=Desulfuromonas versatilis TaxID=2802975 RepID=A0ABM8HZE4_9BACT|nr:B12-binding domain-containing radical SAM protein [Desulfuromonas versatilis]BCR05869.1 B12-binding domain-containing radical SAM protein [Desulfuromonas versatilis]
MLQAMRTILTTLHSKFIHPSLALPCLAAYCGEGCGELLIREFTVHEPRENVLAALLAEAPDVVAFSVYLWNRRETLELADALAAARPELRVVLGGPEVSFEGPGLFERHPGLAALVRGEGEIPLRALLRAWQRGAQPAGVARLAWRDADRVVEGPAGAPLARLDEIPSPFALGLVDFSRGFVYVETSRGCPYRCAFCMSALDESVRSFSMERIRADLGLLMERRVPKVKLVDRTFNYDAARALEIFRFILEHNRGSHFHFEIGAHLLDAATLELLAEVPEGMFQFEIGVQSTLADTLAAIDRRASLERLEANVRSLRQMGNIHLHLDLIAGLPGEGYREFLASIDRVAALRPQHLQIEPVKLLPGAPLRLRAAQLGIRFDPHPPYAVLGTPELKFEQIEQLRGISRLLDLSFNSGRFDGFLEGLQAACGSLSAALERLEAFWREQGLFRHPLSQRGVFEKMGEFVEAGFSGELGQELRERLGRDFARSERVVPGNAPAFLDSELSPEEQQRVRAAVREQTEAIRGQGIKLQHFAAPFERLPEKRGRQVLLFLYFSKTGAGLRVEERLLTPDS